MILISLSRPELGEAIYAVTPDGLTLHRLTFDNCNWGAPAWSPDGTQFVARRMCPGDLHFSLVVCDVDLVVGVLTVVGTTPLTNVPGVPLEGIWTTWPDWSHDGEWIVTKTEVPPRIVKIRADDPYEVVELLVLSEAPGGRSVPRFSPDDTRVLFDLGGRMHSVSALDGSDLTPYQGGRGSSSSSPSR